ncbi:putative exported protein [Plasmodium gaboni]|uniref:Putative exported protein n=1 Tax=Plasmodium gaboni TaxID=647221 RepID=A0A151LLG2_9APIC|nr:putative exported protein [Plasmodium gaboni]KYO00002.1 putative exported protein [Plasmodium gaboni]
MLIKNGSSTKNKITNNNNPNNIHHISKKGKMNTSINYNIFNKIYKYLLLSQLIVFLCINYKNNHKNYFYDQYIYKNESFNTLQNRSLTEIHVNNDYSNLNGSSKNTLNLRPKNINKNDKQNKNNIKEDINSNNNISDDLISKPKNLEDLIFKKRREEAHLNEGKVLSLLDKIKCFFDIFDDFFIDRMIDYDVQKKDSLSLKFITENIVIHAMAFFPFSLATFPYTSDRINFFGMNHEKKKNKKDILYITDNKKELYGVK